MSSDLTKAIQDHHLVRFTYEGRTRVAEPHTYGVDKKGHRALRAYQVDGTSSSSKLGWRMFHESLVSGLEVLPEKFPGPRADYRKLDPAFRLILAEI